MRLEDFQPELIRRAIGVYQAIAWKDCHPRTIPPGLAAARTVDELLALFRDERRGDGLRKYALRLGNSRYPFMKLVLQELLIPGRFFFAVDTHDDLDLKDSTADYEAWLGIKRFNSGLRQQVERAWQEAGIPTFADLVAEMERSAPTVNAGPPRDAKSILVVDDEKAIARSVETVLQREGFRTRWASSAEQALAAIDAEKPDLVVSDLEMDGMTGLDLAQVLRSRPETAGIPFILATAASIGPSNFRLINGFLVKPFAADVLLRFVHEHLD